MSDNLMKAIGLYRNKRKTEVIPEEKIQESNDDNNGSQTENS